MSIGCIFHLESIINLLGEFTGQLKSKCRCRVGATPLFISFIRFFAFYFFLPFPPAQGGSLSFSLTSLISFDSSANCRQHFFYYSALFPKAIKTSSVMRIKLWTLPPYSDLSQYRWKHTTIEYIIFWLVLVKSGQHISDINCQFLYSNIHSELYARLSNVNSDHWDHK